MSDSPDRRSLLRGIGTAGVAGLAGCVGQLTGEGDDGGDGGEPEDDTSTTQPTRTTEAASASEPIRVGMVYALGGLGDKSFNDMANRGVKRARLDYSVQYQNETPSEPDEFTTLQREFATATDPEMDLVCCIGYLQTEPLSTVAPEHPDQRFMIVDGVVEEDNVASYVFKEHEGSFQVGHLAGLLTTRGLSAGGGETRPDERTVGFVGGREAPLIKKFEAGYAAGVAHADEEVSVLRRYAGAFDVPDEGERLANELYDQGADIVYHAAGGTGIGVFEAAQSRSRYAIGVDADQSRSDPRYADVVLASMVKRVNTAVYRAVESVVQDRFSGGDVVSLGLADNGVGAVFGAQLGSAVPDDVKGKLQESRQAIVNGQIDVPTAPGEEGG